MTKGAVGLSRVGQEGTAGSASASPVAEAEVGGLGRAAVLRACAVLPSAHLSGVGLLSRESSMCS